SSFAGIPDYSSAPSASASAACAALATRRAPQLADLWASFETDRSAAAIACAAPAEVDPSWRAVFESFHADPEGSSIALARVAPASYSPGVAVRESAAPGGVWLRRQRRLRLSPRPPPLGPLSLRLVPA